jgi:hypothetical protein
MQSAARPARLFAGHLDDSGLFKWLVAASSLPQLINVWSSSRHQLMASAVQVFAGSAQQVLFIGRQQVAPLASGSLSPRICAS